MSPAKKAPATKAPATKSPAKKAAVKKAPATKAPAKKTAATKAPAKKAAATAATAKAAVRPATEPSPATTAGIVPALGTPRRARKPAIAQAVLPNGLAVTAVRKPGVPLVELRLRIPALPGAGSTAAWAKRAACASLLAEAMLTGAGGLDRAGLAAAIGALGGDMSVSVDADRLLVGANVLTTGLPGLLGLLTTVLTEPAYAPAEVDIERERLIERLGIARSRPGVVAAETLARRMWGAHPYALDLPTPQAVSAITARAVRSLHRQIVRPGAAGATLVLVGDVPPAKLIDQAAAALAPWQGSPAPVTPLANPALPTAPASLPLDIVDRPGSVQSTMRFGRAAVPRSHPDSAALQLANLIFGGYFSSRWTENIREDKGYTYGPHSRIEHNTLGSVLLLDTEVATGVTAPALLETLYELGKISCLPVTADELSAVRQYAIGTLALSTATQAGLASTLSGLSGAGLGMPWLLEHPARLLAVTSEQVSEVAARYFAPSSLTGVIVGDAATITEPLAGLTAVQAAG